VLENGVLRGTFGRKRKDRRKEQSEELYNLYSSPSIIMVIK